VLVAGRKEGSDQTRMAVTLLSGSGVMFTLAPDFDLGGADELGRCCG
jgi:hypothetical protein